MRFLVLFLLIGALLPRPSSGQQVATHDRAYWVALARSGFVLPAGVRAVDVLLEMNPLLASPDPVLRDDVAYSAAERWILRDRQLTAEDLRQLLERWSANLSIGLGEAGTDRVYLRSFSALCLSIIAAADLQVPFLESREIEALFDRVLDYFRRERDVRGFDPVHGWMHSVAHTSDALKFLARNPKLPRGTDRRILDAVAGKIEGVDTVFTWGENDRMALALHSAVRRSDADGEALADWIRARVDAYKRLWAGGPQVDPHQFARVENFKQVMRSLYTALSMDGQPTSTGTAAAQVLLTALATMR